LSPGDWQLYAILTASGKNYTVCRQGSPWIGILNLFKFIELATYSEWLHRCKVKGEKKETICAGYWMFAGQQAGGTGQ
jgi:hypothetical protein